MTEEENIEPEILEGIGNFEQRGLRGPEMVLNPLNPEEASLFVGRDAALATVQRNLDAAAAIDMNSPLRLLIKGSYGSGKTHTLMKIRNLTDTMRFQDRKVELIYAKLTSTQHQSWTDIYKLIINEATGQTKIIGMVFAAYENLSDKLELRKPEMSGTEKKKKIVELLEEITGIRNEELVYVVQQVMKSEIGDSLRSTCWKYLAGFKLSNEELKKLPEINEDCSNPTVAIKNFINLIALHNIAYPDKILVIALDEIEKISKLGNARENYEEGFRQMLDMKIPIGFIFAETLAAGGTTGKPFMESGALASRIGQDGRVTLDDLTESSGKAWFVAFLAAFRPNNDSWKETCKKLMDKGIGITEETFPYEERLIIQCLKDVSDSITPRTILRALQYRGSLQKNAEYFSNESNR
tara:strand:- start:500 stop:1729 length:1230 start_codon:yes stop_codon:yes gene_type:complete